MPRLRIPGALDVAQMLGNDKPDTVARMKKYYGKLPAWGYARARKVARIAYSGAITPDQARRMCHVGASSLGREQNAEVAALIAANAPSSPVLCFGIDKRSLNLRPDFSIPIEPQFFFPRNDRANIVIVQPRSFGRLSDPQLGALAAIIRHVYLIDEFEDAAVWILDCSRPFGEQERRYRMLGLHNLPAPDDRELMEKLGILVDAYDELVRSGFQPPTRRANQASGAGVRQGDLFGD